MTTETILKPIWNWQITIPQERRKILWIDKKHVKAKLDGNKVIIEALEKNKKTRNVKAISFEALNDETQKCVKQAEKDYKAWKKEAFISHEDFWKHV